jgi:2-polyprenyl-6-methoxyphenol hydroxylase-like FAD-dependent oxidoreductase
MQSYQMKRVREALIIGGGIAGPAAALALRRAGIDSVVYEARPESIDDAGALLAIAPNGLAALRILGADGALQALGQPIRTMLIADGRGNRIGEFAGLAGLPPSLAVSRSKLAGALRGQAIAEGIRFECGKRLVAADETRAGVIARFADGSTATGDILVGADGIHSVVRSLIDPRAPQPLRVPLLNFGAVAHVGVRARTDAMHFVFGDGGFFGYWLQADGRTAWFSNLPSVTLMTSAEARAVPADQWLQRLRDAYSHDEPAPTLLQHTTADQLMVLGSMEIMPSLPHWHRGRMVLVGDSAHAPSSSSGQGASLAIESAVELARCLRDIPDATGAFVAYERLRRSRVERVAARAAKTNDGKILGPIARTLMRLLMPIAMRTFLNPERTLGTEQRYLIDWSEVVVQS